MASRTCAPFGVSSTFTHRNRVTQPKWPISLEPKIPTLSTSLKTSTPTKPTLRHLQVLSTLKGSYYQPNRWYTRFSTHNYFLLCSKHIQKNTLPYLPFPSTREHFPGCSHPHAAAQLSAGSQGASLSPHGSCCAPCQPCSRASFLTATPPSCSF